MFTVIGVLIVLVAVVIGYVMHDGNFMVLVQVNEFVIMLGAAVGSLLAANGLDGFKKVVAQGLALLKPDPYTKQTYLDLMKMMYQLFNVARKEGLLGLEQHIERPEESAIIKNYPVFLSNHHACAFFCDTMKVILTGAVGPHDLAEMMEVDLEIAHVEAEKPAHAVQTVGDAMPGFGIVAAVLGVIITMGKIGGEASAIGQSVAAALVGTFLGVLLAYGVFIPISKAMESRVKSEAQYLHCIRYALFSFARGESPITCVEFARRNVEPRARPGFAEMEQAVKERAA
jgi:chemotaxis protein MotA